MFIIQRSNEGKGENMTSKRIIATTLTLLVGLVARAATITWVGPTTIAINTDVNTNGASVFAYTGGAAATVNGVPFTQTIAASMNNHYLQLAGLTGYSANAFTTTSNNFATLSAEYRNMLSGGAFDTGGNVATITLKNLVVGRNYTVQFWINDPRIGDSATRYVLLDGTATEIHYNSTDFAGGVGAYVTGTFTADALTQSFTLDGAATVGAASTQLNAIQLRVEPLSLLAALYWDANSDTAGFGTAGGTWGSSTYWTTNATGSMIPDQPTSTTFSNAIAFGTDSMGLLSGGINVSGTQSFDRITFGLASGPIAVTNGTLALSTPSSTITLNGATNTIGSSLAPGGSLAVRAVNSIYRNNAFPPLTPSEVIVFTNASLVNCASAGATMGGAWINGGSATPTAAMVYFWTNDGTTATFQVQTIDGGFIKCVKVQLSQSGANIVGKALFAKYTTGNLGFNFDTGGTVGTVATGFAASGYGVAEITLDMSPKYRFIYFLMTTPQTVATNITLAAIENIETSIAGFSVDNDYASASIYHFVKTATNATFQAQVYDGGHTKCVKVELLPFGNTIRARTLYAKYILSGDFRGYNFDTGGSDGTLTSTIGGVGYGIRILSLNTSQPTLILSAESAFNSLTTITGATLRVQGRLGNGSLSGAIVNHGRLTLQPSADQTLSGPISGSGSLVADLPPGILIKYAPILTTTYTTIAVNKTLASYTNASGFFSGGSISGSPAATTPYFFTNDGTTATVQFQVYNGGHTKAVKAEFKQVGANIQAKVLYSKHCDPTADNVGTDYDTIGLDNNYDLINITLYPSAPTGRVVLSGSNTYMGGTILNSGEMEITTATSLPALGGIVVNGGHFLFNAPGITDGASAAGGLNNSLSVSAGGVVTLANQFNAGHSRPIILDGGVLHCSYGSLGDGINYVCNLTLKNGARVTGNTLRTGYNSTPTYRIQGNSPSFIESGIMAVNGNGNANWYLDVDNVSSDATTDLTISGNIVNYPGFSPMTTYKRNAGTLSLSGNNSGYTGPVYLEAGYLRLDSTNALTAVNAVYLTGGTLISTTFSNSVGNVSLSSGAITMGTNKLIAGTATLANNTTVNLNTGSLAFANSSAITWTAGKTLNLVGTLGRRSLRFGTTSAGLTATQLQMIKLNGATTRFILDENGYLVELRGTVIQFM
jgi:autotransporter-associated beta strand protein